MRGERLAVANKIAEKIWHKYHGEFSSYDRRLNEWFPDWELPPIGVYRKTKVFCSNPFCCGNPRRIRGAKNGTLTVQELKELERDKDLV